MPPKPKPKLKKPAASTTTPTSAESLEPAAVLAWPAHPLENFSANLKHPSNKVDNGFNHITMPACATELHYQDSIPPFTAPKFTNDHPSQDKPRSAAHKELHYILLIREKLKLTKVFINTELKLKLNPTRDMSKDGTAGLLAAPPIPLSFGVQEYIRDIVNITTEMEGYEGKLEEEGVEERMQELALKYTGAWQFARSAISVLMPGRTEKEQVDKAEDAMIRELGKMIAEPGVDEEDMEMDEVGRSQGGPVEAADVVVGAEGAIEAGAEV